jgi:hypothetical protein
MPKKLKKIVGGEKDKPSMPRYYTRLQAKKQAQKRLLEAQQAASLRLIDARLHEEEQKKRDINAIRELLAKCDTAQNKVDRIEICIETFDYLYTRPLLIKIHDRFRSAITQKITEFEKEIREERQSLKMGRLNRSIAKWRETAQILGLVDVLEEISQRLKSLL